MRRIDKIKVKHKPQFKFDNGGNTIITHDPNDPRLKAYQDSLNAYQEQQDIINKIKKTNLVDTGDGKPLKVDGSKGKIETRSYADKLFNRSQKDWLKSYFLSPGKYNEGTNETMLPSSIMRFPTEDWYDPRSGFVAVYDKPKQPVIYKKNNSNAISTTLNYKTINVRNIKDDVFKPKKESLINLDKIDTPYLQTNQYNLDHLKPREVVKNNNQNFKLVFPEKITMQNAGNPTKTLSFSSEEDMKNMMNNIKQNTGISPNRTTYLQNGTEGSAGYTTYFDEISEKMNEFQNGGMVPPEYEAMSKVISQRNKHLNWVDRGLHPDKYPVINNDDGTISTHRLEYVTGDDGEAYVYPTIIQDNDGKLKQLSSEQAADHAWNTKTAIQIPNQKLAEYYSKNGLIKHNNGGFAITPYNKSMENKKKNKLVYPDLKSKFRNYIDNINQ